MAIFIIGGAFNEPIAAGTPMIRAVSPATGARGTNVTITVTGVNTNLAQGTTQVA